MARAKAKLTHPRPVIAEYCRLDAAGRPYYVAHRKHKTVEEALEAPFIGGSSTKAFIYQLVEEKTIGEQLAWRNDNVLSQL